MSGTVDGAHLLYNFGFMLAVVFLGSVIFNKVEQTFMDNAFLTPLQPNSAKHRITKGGPKIGVRACAPHPYFRVLFQLS